MNKKGFSEIVAVILLFLVTVLTVVSFNIWYDTFESDVYIKLDSEDNSPETRINGLVETDLYVNFDYNSTVLNLKIATIECNNVNGSYVGLEKFNVSECLSNVNTQNPEIVLITNKEIIRKFIYIEDKEILNIS